MISYTKYVFYEKNCKYNTLTNAIVKTHKNVPTCLKNNKGTGVVISMLGICHNTLQPIKCFFFSFIDYYFGTSSLRFLVKCFITV